MKHSLKTIINWQCQEMGIQQLALEVMPDHLHFFGSGFDNLLARGYYCGSAGYVSQEQVKKYIQEQMGKDVFEYDIYRCHNELK